ncbi:unnamed protein product [Symbiodinium sp. CCMP2456]|nr:unnamed protein product [Symbiodinium sp. CCMP2456]
MQVRGRANGSFIQYRLLRLGRVRVETFLPPDLTYARELMHWMKQMINVYSMACLRDVLQYIREHGQSRTFKITKAPDNEGVEFSPGLGWHEVKWRGKLQILVMERLQGAHVHRRLVIVELEPQDGSIREFLKVCRTMARAPEPAPTPPEEPGQQTPKFWVQELVEKAIREEEEAEQRQSPPDDWSKMDKEEAKEKGAKRLGLDFDPLAPS